MQERRHHSRTYLLLRIEPRPHASSNFSATNLHNPFVPGDGHISVPLVPSLPFFVRYSQNITSFTTILFDWMISNQLFCCFLLSRPTHVADLSLRHAGGPYIFQGQGRPVRIDADEEVRRPRFHDGRVHGRRNSLFRRGARGSSRCQTVALKTLAFLARLTSHKSFLDC